ncbi:hypothetical protein ACQKQC_16210 [Vibrio fortis]|uniref:hypothetical protein n=1 Tax=Vibrio fortis TaxID=212667 RepID=UPI004068B394
MKFINKFKNEAILLLAVFASSTAMAAPPKKLSTWTSSFIGELFSLGGLFAMLAFIGGLVATFKIVIIFLNHNDDKREYPLKNCIYYAVAAALGFGYAYQSDLVQGTFFGESSKVVDAKKAFKINK